MSYSFCLNPILDDKLGHAYFYAKEVVKREGFITEIETQESIDFEGIDAKSFIKETAWVILNSGMRESVIRKIWTEFSKAFYDWNDPKKILNTRGECYKNALKTFNYPRKIHSIIECISIISSKGFSNFKNEIKNKGVDVLEELPFIGKITKYHLAKNVGLNYSKPDRHLQRISDHLNFVCVHDMCSIISKTTYEQESVVDLVLWRFATLNPDYLNKLNWYFYNRV